MKEHSYNNFFTNFANKTRFKIIMALRKKPLNVNSLSKQMGEEQSKVSHNLKILADCNVLEVKKRGKERIYSLNKDTVIPLLKLVEKHVKKHCPYNCCK